MLWGRARSRRADEWRSWLAQTQTPLLAWSSQGRGFFLDSSAPEDRSDPERVRELALGALPTFDRLARGLKLQKGNEAKVYGNAGTYNFGGDGGNIIYYGGDKASTVNLGLSFMTLYGGAGNDILRALVA